MTGTFLHDDHKISPDELGDTPPPCPSCATEMWLVAVHTRVSDGETDGKYKYECRNCGEKEEVHRIGKLHVN